MSVDVTKEAEIISEKNESWTGNCETRAIAAAARIKTLIPKFAYFNKFEKSVKKWENNSSILLLNHPFYSNSQFQCANENEGIYN